MLTSLSSDHVQCLGVVGSSLKPSLDVDDLKGILVSARGLPQSAGNAEALERMQQGHLMQSAFDKQVEHQT